MNGNVNLTELNEEQLRACTSTDGAFRLIAGAGSGKTFTLTKRVAYIVDTKKINPSRVLSLTFTNKAAEEMKERCAKLLHCDKEELNMMTFHSLALKICKEDMPKYMGWKNGVQVGNTPFYMYAELAVNALAPEGIADETIRDYVKRRLAGYILKVKNSDDYIKYFDVTKDLDVTPANILEVYHYEKQKEDKGGLRQKALYRKKALEKAIKEQNNPSLKSKLGESMQELDDLIVSLAHYHNDMVLSPTATWAIKALNLAYTVGSLTFDDIINCALYLLDNYPDVRMKWQSKYDYIQVDEFQDTDWKQLMMVKHLYARAGNLFVVGDPDQSIYSFRKGVDSQLFNNLPEYIPHIVTIFMQNNYRSSKNIVSAGNSIIKLNRNRIVKDLVSQSSGANADVEILSDTESESLADKEYHLIQDLLKEYTPNDIAVLYRDMNSEVTQELVTKLESLDIPLDNQLVILEYGADLLKNIDNLFKFKYLRDNGDYKGATKYFNNFIAIIKDSPADFLFMDDVYEKLSACWDNSEDAVKLICDYYMRLKYKDPYSNVNIRKNPYNHRECADRLIEEIDCWKEKPDSQKFAECSDENMLITKTENHAEGLHIMTYHASKGLEYKVVIVNDMDNSSLLKLREGEKLETLEETVRLAYVASSRAKERLYIGLSDANSPYAYRLQDLAKWDVAEFKEKNREFGETEYISQYDNLAKTTIYAIRYKDLGPRKSTFPKDEDVTGTVIKVPYKGEMYLLRLSITLPGIKDVITEYRYNNAYRLGLELNGAYIKVNVKDMQDASWMIGNYEDDDFVKSSRVQKYLAKVADKNMRDNPIYMQELGKDTNDIYSGIVAQEKNDVVLALGSGVMPIDRNMKPYLPFTFTEFKSINNTRRNDRQGKPARILHLNLKKDVCTLERDGVVDNFKVRQIVFEITSNVRYYLTNPSMLKDWKYWSPEQT